MPCSSDLEDYYPFQSEDEAFVEIVKYYYHIRNNIEPDADHPNTVEGVVRFLLEEGMVDCEQSFMRVRGG